MKIAYIDVVGGLSGDMLIGALIDTGLDPKILEIELRKITSEGWNLSINKCFRNSVNASNITFNIVNCDTYENKTVTYLLFWTWK